MSAPRVYFYHLNALGHLYHLSEEKAAACLLSSADSLQKMSLQQQRAAQLPSGPAHLRMVPFLNFFFRQLRPTGDIEGLSENQKLLVQHFPFQSICKGELNLLHTAETPFVYHSFDIELDSAESSKPRKLLYAGNLKQEFSPSQIRVDEEDGKLYYPSPSVHYKNPCLIASPLAIQLSQLFTEHETPTQDYSGVYLMLDAQGNKTNSIDTATPLLFLGKE